MSQNVPHDLGPGGPDLPADAALELTRIHLDVQRKFIEDDSRSVYNPFLIGPDDPLGYLDGSSDPVGAPTPGPAPNHGLLLVGTDDPPFGVPSKSTLNIFVDFGVQQR